MKLLLIWLGLLVFGGLFLLKLAGLIFLAVVDRDGSVAMVLVGSGSKKLLDACLKRLLARPVKGEL